MELRSLSPILFAHVRFCFDSIYFNAPLVVKNQSIRCEANMFLLTGHGQQFSEILWNRRHVALCCMSVIECSITSDEVIIHKFCDFFPQFCQKSKINWFHYKCFAQPLTVPADWFISSPEGDVADLATRTHSFNTWQKFKKLHAHQRKEMCFSRSFLIAWVLAAPLTRWRELSGQDRRERERESAQVRAWPAWVRFIL